MDRQQYSVSRRRFLAVAGLGSQTGSAGCTQPPSKQDTARTATADGTDRKTESEGTASDLASTSVFYSTRSEAISYAGSFATAEGATLGTPTSGGASRIQYTERIGGTGGTNGERESALLSQHPNVRAIADGGVRFGGDSGRTLRVRNLATQSALTFSPAGDVGAYDVSEFDIEVGGEGYLYDDTPTIEVAKRDSDPIELEGVWQGDSELFRHQPFARYVVELVENGAVIGTTESRIFGTGYQYGFDQSATTAFVTRQPAVRTGWDATFYLGGVYDPVDSVSATPRPEAGVFEIDLTALDVAADEYDWALRIGDGDAPDQFSGYMRLRSDFGNTVFIDPAVWS